MRKYRGKYPTRLALIWSAFGGHRFAKTNDGVLYWINPNVANRPGMMPKIGDDATEHPACVLQEQDADGNNRAAHDTMLDALRAALDELTRLGADGACVRPDVPYAVHRAIRIAETGGGR